MVSITPMSCQSQASEKFSGDKLLHYLMLKWSNKRILKLLSMNGTHKQNTVTAHVLKNMVQEYQITCESVSA